MTRSGLVLALILVAAGVAALRFVILGGARPIEEIPLLVPPSEPPPAEASRLEAADTRTVRESSAEPPAPLPAPLHVAGASPDLVTVVQIGASIRGRAVDDVGAPIEKFSVRAKNAGSSATVVAEGARGSFELSNLGEGTWELRASAPFHAPSDARTVTLPADLELVELVLARCADVSGIVRLPTGAAASGADVRDIGVQGFGDGSRHVKADDEGRFRLEKLSPGTRTIVASSPGYADSEPIGVELRSGAPVADLELRLGTGGRIVGEVFGKDGVPLPERSVQILSSPTRIDRQVRSDASGRFEFEALTPGTYLLSVLPTGEELPTECSDFDRATNLLNERSAVAYVTEGETTHVTLGSAGREGIRVHGLITRGKAPVQGCHVQFRREGADSTATRKGSTDEEGRYELLLEGEGRYLLEVSERVTSLEHVDVPDVADFVHDIALPSARVAGRVLRKDGSPAAEILVMLEPQDRTTAFTDSTSFGFGRTSRDGAFEFDGLRRGSYRIRAGDIPGSAQTSGSGIAVRESLELADGDRIDDLELRLETPASLEGVVKGPDGKPYPSAFLVVRDEGGSTVVRLRSASGPLGTFVIGNLSPGTVFVGARTDRLVTPEPVRVALAHGEVARVELSLQPGTKLRVLLRAKDGTPVEANLSVLDARGRVAGAAFSFGQDEFGKAVRPEDGVSLGPVPPGEYSFVATKPDGTSSRQEFSVSGEEQTVTLTFDG